jgi:alpha-ketoglutarate-dependent taurine dioxygenase
MRNGPFTDMPQRSILMAGRNKRRAIMTLFRNLFPRRQSRREAELAYLNGAVSLYDLEQREREIDRGRFARF